MLRESVFEGTFDGAESCGPSDRAFRCIPYVFKPSKVVAAIAAKYPGIIGHRCRKIDESMASPAFEECGGQVGHEFRSVGLGTSMVAK